MAGRFQTPNEQFLDENGNPLAGGKLEFFDSGTSTPRDTYTDDNLNVPNSNPVILDDAGRAGDIFLDNSDYKVVLKKSDDTVVWTADPVRSVTPKSSEVRTVTTTTQLDTSDDGKWIAADATSGSFVVTLPAVANVPNGYEVTVQKVDSSSNQVTLDGNGSETINGVSDVTLERQYEAITVRSDGTRWLTPLEEGRSLTPNHIDGFELSNGGTPATEINISAGSARSDDDGADIVRSASITKILNQNFAEGNNQGCLDTGAVAADTSYDIYAISKDDGTADILATKKGDNPALPSGFNNKRFIGRLATDGSSNIVANQFTQQRIDGQYYESILDVSGGGSSGSPAQARGMPDDPENVDIVLLEVSASSNADGRFRLGGDTSVETTGYVGQCEEIGGASTSPTDSIAFSRNVSSALSVGGLMRLRKGNAQGAYGCDGTITRGSGTYLTAATKALTAQALSALDFYPQSGDFDDGTITVSAFKASYTP